MQRHEPRCATLGWTWTLGGEPEAARRLGQKEESEEGSGGLSGTIFRQPANTWGGRPRPPIPTRQQNRQLWGGRAAVNPSAGQRTAHAGAAGPELLCSPGHGAGRGAAQASRIPGSGCEAEPARPVAPLILLVPLRVCRAHSARHDPAGAGGLELGLGERGGGRRRERAGAAPAAATHPTRRHHPPPPPLYPSVPPSPSARRGERGGGGVGWRPGREGTVGRALRRASSACQCRGAPRQR
eukprot:1707989-Rhodomonas_salina.3